MAHAFVPALAADVRTQERLNRSAWWTSYGAVLVASGFVGLLALRDLPAPLAFTLTMLLLSAVAILARPVVGVYLALGLALAGDAQLAPWYPFTKNLSSVESIAFLHPKLVLSPLDIVVAATVASWLVSRLSLARPPLQGGRLLAPLTAFTGFIVLGFVHGMATGGDRTVGMWEVRPLLYLPLVYVLATNLITSRQQVRRLLWVIVGAVTVEGLYGLAVLTVFPDELVPGTSTGSIVEHSAAMHTNLLFVLAAAAWVYPRVSRRLRWALLAPSLLVLTPYLVAERRAAVAGLVVALLLLAVVLFRERRRAFFLIVPALAVAASGYVAATWSSTGAAGLPAQAVKSVVAPDQMTEEDRLSGAYRDVETYNLVETIKASPILGHGLGHKFLRPISLPDISFFVWWEYIPHNSVLWIWTQLGVGGFLAMLHLFGAAIAHGVRASRRLGHGVDAAVTLGSVLVVVMFLVYAYVDMAWDAQSMVLLGASLAVIANVERLPARCGELDGELALTAHGGRP